MLFTFIFKKSMPLILVIITHGVIMMFFWMNDVLNIYETMRQMYINSNIYCLQQSLSHDYTDCNNTLSIL